MSTRTLEKKAYRYYMRTNKWQAKRDAVLERDNHECQRCGNKHNLQVHHLTYANVYNERLEDLVTWCKPCHVYHHDSMFKRHNRRTAMPAGVCRGCGEQMEKPYWGPGGGYYCGYTCKGR